MILRFRHKGLRRAFDRGDWSGLPPAYRDKIKRVLFALDSVSGPDALNLPGYGLHPLTGDLSGYWSITISRNWRIVFRFEREDATDVDLVDYH